MKKEKTRKKRRLPRILALVTLFAVLFCVLTVALINGVVVGVAGEYILAAEEAAELEDVDCILVLGCAVWDSGPSHMLQDRLRRSMELYDLGVADRLLMSGDHGREDYDEVDAMKHYAVDAGAPAEAVFMDHAGFSTYESMYRAADVFQAKKVVIVTQEYHLYRAVYIARQLGLEAYGVASDYRSYSGQTARDIREILARVKDFGTCIFRPEPTYRGPTIPIWGDGNLTNDENSVF